MGTVKHKILNMNARHTEQLEETIIIIPPASPTGPGARRLMPSQRTSVPESGWPSSSASALSGFAHAKGSSMSDEYTSEWMVAHLGQASPNGSCLLRAQVEGNVFLPLIELPQVLASLLVRDRKHARDRLAHGVAKAKATQCCLQMS